MMNIKEYETSPVFQAIKARLIPEEDLASRGSSSQLKIYQRSLPAPKKWEVLRTFPHWATQIGLIVEEIELYIQLTKTGILNRSYVMVQAVFDAAARHLHNVIVFASEEEDYKERLPFTGKPIINRHPPQRRTKQRRNARNPPHAILFRAGETKTK